MTKKKQMTVKESNAVALPEGFGGAISEVSSTDLKMARIKVMASNAELVQTDVARAGAIIDLESHEELGYKDSAPVEFVILRQYKYWYQTINGEFAERVPGLDRNEREFFYTNENGDKVANDFYHEFIVLLVNQVEDGIDVPYTVRFRRGELKQLEKVTKKLVRMGKEDPDAKSWNTSFLLTAGIGTRTAPDGTKSNWLTPNVAIGNETSEKVRKVSLEWCVKTLAADVNPTIINDKVAVAQSSPQVANEKRF